MIKVQITDKLDGASLVLTYMNGQLKTAATRGDGQTGDDITPNAVQFQGVKLTIAYLGTVIIRGEAIMPTQTFKAKYSDGKNNARNVTNGMIKAKELPAGKDLTDVHFVAYDITGASTLKTERAKLDCLSDWGFETPTVCYCDKKEQVAAYYQEMAKNREAGRLPYTIDGLVIKIDNLDQQNQFDTVDGRPRGQIALKFAPATVVATVKSILWEQGNSGRFCPVAELEPIMLGGEVTLKRVTLHNVQQLHRLKVTPGAKVLVCRAGDCIPYIMSLVTPGVPYYKQA